MTISIPLNPPTSQLPPIAKIKSASLQDIVHAIGYLRLVYNPEVRGSRRIDRKVVFNASRIATESPEAFNEAHEPNAKQVSSSSDRLLDALRADDFERSYAIRWLTSFVSRAGTLVARDERDEGSADSLSSEQYELAWENTIQDAAAILAICAGTASAGMVSRAFAFRHKTGREVKVQVTDVPLENQDYSSVGAQTWGSACLLAEMIVDAPVAFGLDYSNGAASPLRVLELGAGTGLVSLTIAGLLKGAPGNHAPPNIVSIVATDFHPSVLQNLRNNVDLNTSTWPELSPVSISAKYLDWSQLPVTPYTAPFDRPFDLIFGADIVYEMEHTKWIRGCVERFLCKPHSGYHDMDRDVPRFHLTIPLRPTHAAESQSVEEVFPFATVLESTLRFISSPQTLAIVAKEILVCEVQGSLRSRSAGRNSVEYVHYTIAWV